MTEKERVEEIRFFLKKNKTEFAKVLGYTTPQSYTNYQSSNGGSISIKMIRALKDYDSRISMDWILTGQGQMLLNQSSSDNNNIQQINNTDADGTITMVNDQSNNYGTKSTKFEVEILKKENEHLKTENDLLKKSLTDKERLISFLEKNQK